MFNWIKRKLKLDKKYVVMTPFGYTTKPLDLIDAIYVAELLDGVVKEWRG